MAVAVVGSGPAALACTHALLRRGASVTLLDTGERLEPELQSVVDRMKAQPKSSWSAADRVLLQRNPTISGRKIPRRLAFGSDFVYRAERPSAPLDREDLVIAPTYARGGYSTVWGAAMLPVHGDDIGDWPIARATLEPYYAAVLADLPYSARDDGLSREFPLFDARAQPLRLGGQASALLADLDAAELDTGSRDRLLHGQARLAVRAQDTADGDRGCVYCGLCLAGCVKGAIYNASDDLDRLIAAGRVDYRGGVLVRTVAELEDRVDVSLVSADGASHERLSFERVFVAAGAVNSTRILLASLGLFDTPLQLRHSPKFVVPFLRLPSHPLAWPDANTLAALFLECRFPGVSSHWLHVQISVLSDMVLTALGAYRNDAWTLRGRLAKPLLRRLMVALCGLHSNEAEPISVLLRGSSGGREPVLELRAPADDGQLAATIRRAAARLARKGLSFRSLFLTPFVASGASALGNHYGGTLPMRARPRHPFETDLLGRPAGLTRTHVVDASVLPSVPATTLALTIMANARRIGDQAPLDA